MTRSLILLSVTIICFSCGSSDKKAKETVTTDTAVNTAPDTANSKPVAPAPVASDTTKTVNLIFSGYEEGDYAHLMFKDGSTDYDFGHPEDNNLDNIQVVLKDNNASFGYKENSKMKGAKFIAELVYKMTDTYDGNGQPVKGKEWRITSLKKAE